MRQLIMIIALALIVGSGAVVAVAQTGGTQVETEAEEAGGSGACIGTPIASPAASPELEEIVETETPDPGDLALLATAVASPSDALAVLAQDPCATPEIGTPAS